MKLMSERVKNIKIRVIEDIHDYELENSRLLEDLDKLIFECENEESEIEKHKNSCFRYIDTGLPVKDQNDYFIRDCKGIVGLLTNDVSNVYWGTP